MGHSWRMGTSPAAHIAAMSDIAATWLLSRYPAKAGTSQCVRLRRPEADTAGGTFDFVLSIVAGPFEEGDECRCWLAWMRAFPMGGRWMSLIPRMSSIWPVSGIVRL